MILFSVIHDIGSESGNLKFLFSPSYGNKKPAISSGFFIPSDFFGWVLGGDEGDRTPGLGVANAALSQLSYIPNFFIQVAW